MKFQSIITAIAALATPMAVVAKSQDYARHIKLSLLFYEAQRSGKLPENNRIYWRFDSMLDAGADHNVDLTGGYYDAGDNVKFNFPAASTLTLLAWSGVDYAEGYKAAGQWDYYLDAIKWGADYFMKCHTGKNELYVQVGDGNTDHAFWYPPEYIKYEYPSFKITAEKPGSEVAGETAAFLAAASILFKDEDSSYSAKLLKHAKEIYEFADTYRGDYTGAVPGVVSFYNTYSGYMDELAWGAAWLLRATGDDSYLDKYNVIANKKYESYDPKKFSGATGPISWDDKRPGCYILIAMVTNDEKRIQEAYNYCDAVLKQPKTAGGLWYDDGLSMWGANRYASNAAAMVAMFANYLPKSDSKRAQYVDFVQQQTNYILGDNPAKVNYVVGAEANSPKAVHHRAASGTYDSQDTNAKPTDFNIFTLWGALAGGPGSKDEYTDSRKNYEMNEVALDYNAAFQMNLAFLVKEGYNKPDPDSVKVHDRSFPKKADTPDITVEVTEKTIEVSTGSNMLCSSWCIEFTTNYKIEAVHDCIMHQDGPDYIICNRRESNFLDGKGTPQHWNFNFKKPNGGDGLDILPKTAIFYCNGKKNGQAYLVNTDGSGAEPYGWEAGACRPSFLCDGSAPQPSTPTNTKTKTKTTTTTKKSEQTSSGSCFTVKKNLGFPCCKFCETIYTDDSGDWGVENGEWCGIPDSCSGEQPVEEEKHSSGYPYCKTTTDVAFEDNDKWGIENGDWCVIKSDNSTTPKCECWSVSQGYQCCTKTSDVVYTDESGSWGVEDGEWCGIKKC